MEPNRSNWYLLTAFLLGITLGLVYAWVISPTAEVDTHPSSLREDYKDIYRALIARAFQANNNLPRAEARLALLGDESPSLALAAQAQRFLAEGGDLETAKVLANLSSALQMANQPDPPADATLAATPSPGGPITATVGISSTPVVQGTVVPGNLESSPSPTATAAPPFIVQDSSPICDPTLGDSLIQVFATNASGEGIPGVAVLVTADDGQQEQFFTGLKPELGFGYADFEAEPGIRYQLETSESGILASDIEIPQCENESGDEYWGSWEIYLTHPN